MKGKRYLVALSLLIMGLLLASGTKAQELGEIFQEANEKTLNAADTVAFEWLVYNKNESSIFVRVNATPSAGGEWSSRILPKPYFILSPGESQNVSLVLRSTESLPQADVTITVLFNLSIAGEPTLVSLMPREVIVHFVPLPLEALPENKILNYFVNPLPSPWNSRIATFFISIAIWALIGALIVFIIDPIFKMLSKRTKTEIDDVIWGVVRRPLFVLVIVYGAISSLLILNLDKNIISWLGVAYQVVVIIVISWLAYLVFRGVIIRYGSILAEKTETKIDDILFPVIRKIGTIIIFVVAGAMIAAYFGYDITAFLAGMGVLGIAIAFAAQESLSNFFSGLFLLLDRPFKEGDLIEIDGKRCRIERIGLRSTKLYHRSSHKMLVIPNNKLSRDIVVNIVEPDLAYRMSIMVGVSYDSDIEKVKKLMVGSALSHQHVLRTEGREPYARLEEFADSSIIMKLRFWIDNADMRNRYAAEVREIINENFKKERIEIPFPIRDIYVKKWGEKET